MQKYKIQNKSYLFLHLFFRTFVSNCNNYELYLNTLNFQLYLLQVYRHFAHLPDQLVQIFRTLLQFCKKVLYTKFPLLGAKGPLFNFTSKLSLLIIIIPFILKNLDRTKFWDRKMYRNHTWACTNFSAPCAKGVVPTRVFLKIR